MAVDKGLVLKAIEDRFKGKSLTKNFKENLATKWADKIEDEDGIDAFIEYREDVILEANSEADRRAIAAAKKAKEEKSDEKKDDKKDEPDLTDVPDWAKALIKSNTDLNEKLAGIEAGKKQDSIKDKFLKDDRVKNIPDFIRNGYIPTSDDDFEDKVTSLSDSYKAFAEKNKLQDYGNDTPAGGSKTDPTKVKEITPEQAKQIVQSMTS